MAKLIPLYDELIFLDIVPEIHPEFFERIKKTNVKTKSNDYIIHYHLLYRHRFPRPRQFHHWLHYRQPKVSPYKISKSREHQ